MNIANLENASPESGIRRHGWWRKMGKKKDERGEMAMDLCSVVESRRKAARGSSETLYLKWWWLSRNRNSPASILL
jgi:hypothetical protein